MFKEAELFILPKIVVKNKTNLSFGGKKMFEPLFRGKEQTTKSELKVSSSTAKKMHSLSLTVQKGVQL